MREYRDYLGPDQSRPYALGSSPAVKALIIANVAIYFGWLILSKLVIPYGFGYTKPIPLFQWVGVDPDAAIGKGYIWQFFTYAFFHQLESPLHLVFNMLALYFFGREIEALYGTRKFLFLYVAAAVFAGLCHCIDYHRAVPAIGASGAVYAVMVVFALHFPHQKILFFFLLPLEVWLVVTILIGIDVAVYLGSPGSGGGVARLAHLGGAFFGFLFYRFQGSVEAYIEEMEGRMAKREQAQEEELEARLDTVLDKINREGMGALSKKEWEILKKASKHYQRRP